MFKFEDLLVVSLEQAVAAPFCSNRLANAGARVIKVERAEGDFARGYDDVVHGESAYFVCLNQGKESMIANIKDPDDAALLQRILAHADVFIQNLAPGAAARAGLGSAELHERYPRLICCDISGYGESGEYRDMKAYDLLVQCESGMASITGTPDAPGRIGVSACDINCGQQAYSGILEALVARESSGRGSIVQVSLFDGMAEWLAVPLLHYDYGNRIQPRVGISHATIAPYGAYTCRDGQQVVLAIQNDREWRRFCEQILGDVAIADDPDLSSPKIRADNRALLDKHINRAFAELDADEVVTRLQQADIAYGRINDMAGLSQHPQLRRQTVDTPSGEADVVAVAAVHSDLPSRRPQVPALGQHDAAIRSEFSED